MQIRSSNIHTRVEKYQIQNSSESFDFLNIFLKNVGKETYQASKRMSNVRVNVVIIRVHCTRAFALGVLKLHRKALAEISEQIWVLYCIQNSFHVICASGESSRVLLSGFGV